MKSERNLVIGRLGLPSIPLTVAKFPISPSALRFLASPATFFFGCCLAPPTPASPIKIERKFQ